MKVFHFPSRVESLAHINLESIYGTSANSTEPDQMPQNAESDQVLHCLITECTLRI